MRTTAIDALVSSFLATDASELKQVVSLGAGSDTRFFRLASAGRPSTSLLYHELDFPTNTAQKIAAIQRQPSLMSAIRSSLPEGADITISADGTSLTSATYNLHPLDLRTLYESASSKSLQITSLSSTAPTLIISECCLCYLSPSAADSVLSTFTTSLIPAPTPLALVIYEPIRPDDAFGRVMIANLAARGIVLQTLKKFSSLSRQRERLRMSGFTSGQDAADVDFIMEKWVSDAEKERVATLEMLDEVEEWRLLAQHYCVAWGWRNPEAVQDGIFARAWADIKGEGQADDE